MKSGKMTFFRRRSYWTQFMWLGIMAVGCLVGIGYRSIALFVMTIISAFLGLNEYGRWSYKTNLVLCSIVAIAGTLAGAFTWLETASVFVLMQKNDGDGPFGRQAHSLSSRGGLAGWLGRVVLCRYDRSRRLGPRQQREL